MRHVRGLVNAGVPFEHIEAYVERCPELSEDERALLWCFAWLGAAPGEVAELLGREVSAA